MASASRFYLCGCSAIEWTGLTCGYRRYREVQSNRVFVTVECLYGFKVTLPDGVKRIVKP